MTTVAFHVDGYLCGTRELCQRQPEGYQQDLLRPSMKRGRNGTEQQTGGLRVKGRRKLPRGLVGIRLGVYRRQQRRDG
ncbi:Uncharacterised protein [Mycobacteroides abscessus subsp. abscessus]|nr:Uncharacterised protein [Mycobacteroides abscessus subsp. abscessus]